MPALDLPVLISVKPSRLPKPDTAPATVVAPARVLSHAAHRRTCLTTELPPHGCHCGPRVATTPFVPTEDLWTEYEELGVGGKNLIECTKQGALTHTRVPLKSESPTL